MALYARFESVGANLSAVFRKRVTNAETEKCSFVASGDGGAKGIRTPDLLNAIQTLYQLSYDPIRSGSGTVEMPITLVKNYLG